MPNVGLSRPSADVGPRIFCSCYKRTSCCQSAHEGWLMVRVQKHRISCWHNPTTPPQRDRVVPHKKHIHCTAQFRTHTHTRARAKGRSVEHCHQLLSNTILRTHHARNFFTLVSSLYTRAPHPTCCCHPSHVKPGIDKGDVAEAAFRLCRQPVHHRLLRPRQRILAWQSQPLCIQLCRTHDDGFATRR